MIVDLNKRELRALLDHIGKHAADKPINDLAYTAWTKLEDVIDYKPNQSPLAKPPKIPAYQLKKGH